MRRLRRLGTWLARGVLAATLVVLVLLAAVAVIIETAWGKDRLRALIVSQANQYLTATLGITRLGGSILRGVELDGVTLSRDGRTLVALDHVVVSYSPRELFEGGTIIRRLAIDGLRVSATRLPDGSWDIAGLVRRDPNRPPSTSAPRPIQIDSIVLQDAEVTLGSPVSLGAARIPMRYTNLRALLAFASGPEGWRLDFADASFGGAEPELRVSRLAGALGSGPEGWHFRDLQVETPRSNFSVSGDVDRRQQPTQIDFTVAAPAFAFQEWAGVLSGLRNINVVSRFNLRLRGPTTAMETSIDLASDGGAVRGTFVLDSAVPGWHGRGTADVQRLDLAHWLNRTERRSDISGSTTFDLDLHLGGRFPSGTFTFDGTGARYLGYAASDVVARGRITDTEVQIAAATATAYGANVRLGPSTLAIDEPFAFHFVGRADGVDLRRLPSQVPVPHVESRLAMDYDVTGQFTRPFLRGSAVLGDSTFLGARVGAGATGSIDTGVTPMEYAGEGDLADVDLNRFGRDLEIGWLSEPRYDGQVRGRFRVRGTGTDLATMTLTGGGRLDSATIFGGVLRDADVSVTIAGGSLEGMFDGQLLRIDPSMAMADRQYHAELTGRGRATFAVRGLLTRSISLADYGVDASLTLRESVLRDVPVTSGAMSARLRDGVLAFETLRLQAPGADIEASGPLALDASSASNVTYRLTHSDLSRLEGIVGPGLAGEFVSDGTLDGAPGRWRVRGSGTLTRFAGSGFDALTTSVDYDVTLPDAGVQQSVAAVELRSSMVRAFGRDVPELQATVRFDAGRVQATIDAVTAPDIRIAVQTTGTVDTAARSAVLTTLGIAAFRSQWTLAPGVRPALAWTLEGGVRVRALNLVDAAGGPARLSIDGAWEGPGSALRVHATGLSIDAFLAETGGPPPYGGTVNLQASIGGTRERPVLTADFVVADGRIRRLPFDHIGGRVGYADGTLDLDVRFDQAPGVWLTAVGDVPLALLDRTRPPAPMRVAVRSSRVSLTLLEGVSDVIRKVDGQMEVDVTVVGTSRDPLFSGRLDVEDASFEVVSTGARYHNGRMALQLARERVDVQLFRVEDDQGNPLELTGSLGTRELRVGNLRVALTARQFRVLRNEYGEVDIDAKLNFDGEFESPRMTGSIGVSRGTVNVDRILDRALFQPYSTRAQEPLPKLDPIVALNPWERMGLDVEVNVPGTLRLVGENVQVTPGTPLGLGDINLRTVGDVYLYKDPAQPLYVNGSFYQVSGTYAFQGRRFDLDPNSSINFRGDLNPELYVMVNRLISGVDTRVSIVGPLRQPELRLTSVPPLDPSDVLSLIVFNTSTNELSALQQQQLAVRAGTLAAGFLAAPMVSALERSLGIDTLEIEPGADIRSGPRVTIGNEIAPGLVARFSRQFGPAEYDEATLEYYLSRILRIRATFSDAGTLSARSPFRRVERAGIDLLLFFSF